MPLEFEVENDCDETKVENPASVSFEITLG